MPTLANSVNLATLAPDYIRAINAYQPGKPISDVARELGLREEDIVKLASNENPLGASPAVTAALSRALGDLASYPDAGGYALKAAIAQKFGVAHDEIVLGNGSNDVLELIARTFLQPGDSAIYSQYAFAVYPLSVQCVGARGIEVPARAYGNDLDALLAAVEPSTKIIFLANPNNPTGTFIEANVLKDFIANVPANVLIVLDEAYGEYLDASHAYNSVAWRAEYPNLIISRTLSKAYGLAGLRIGFCFAQPALVALMNAVRQPFNVNQLAMVAAVAALGDEAFINESRRVNAEGLAYLADALRSSGYETIPSYANFITFKIGRARDVFEALMRRGIIVRPIAGYGLPDWLRVSIGTAAQNGKFLTALDAVRKELKV
jgi:histidinol-phosphate aminotransferase